VTLVFGGLCDETRGVWLQVMLHSAVDSVPRFRLLKVTDARQRTPSPDPLFPRHGDDRVTLKRAIFQSGCTVVRMVVMQWTGRYAAGGLCCASYFVSSLLSHSAHKRTAFQQRS
jgi:hypothetical protein